MKFEEVVQLLKADILSEAGSGSQDITGGYACDMISRMISKIAGGEAWITILNSRNVVAAATISDCSCIILAESVKMETETVQLAVQNSIPVISTALSAYQVCAALAERLKA
ncbi:MAG: DRTGG domain-containing protein [Saccharofermentanales bacterium]